jgi:hypothetical protein
MHKARLSTPNCKILKYFQLVLKHIRVIIEYPGQCIHFLDKLMWLAIPSVY